MLHRGTKSQLKQQQNKQETKSDYEILRQHHQFLHSEQVSVYFFRFLDLNACNFVCHFICQQQQEQQRQSLLSRDSEFARKYDRKLKKDFVICDLSQYSDGNVREHFESVAQI